MKCDCGRVFDCIQGKGLGMQSRREEVVVKKTIEAGVFYRRIGNTRFKVRIHTDAPVNKGESMVIDSTATIKEKIRRMIQNELDVSFKHPGSPKPSQATSEPAAGKEFL